MAHDPSERAAHQLKVIDWLDTVLTKQGIDYWLFGGWAVDLHAGRVTREHDDVDLAVWQIDLDRVRRLLQAHDWAHIPGPHDEGYTSYGYGDVRVELAFLIRDETGIVYTPLTEGRGEWPRDSFGGETAEVNRVRARVVSLASLIEDKSGYRDDAGVAAKDRGDVEVLTALARG